MSTNILINELRAFETDLKRIRRTIHRHPELGFQERHTAKLVAGYLRDWGLEVAEGIAETGVVATLHGSGGAGRSIGLRADMDALALHETPGRDHCSTEPGRMHACGHDGHTTMLLGAARYLAHRRDFRGTIQFIFQPAEEGLGGARRMIDEGLFERFPVDAVYGMHNWPGIPAGEFRIRPGAFFAASDTWRVTFHGTGGHGGTGAHLGTDVTVAQSHFQTALQTIVSRDVAGIEAAVVSVGHVGAGSPHAPNVIPSEATVIGTARSFTPDTRALIMRRLQDIAVSQATAFGCTATVHVDRLFPSLVNHEREAATALRAAASLVGTARASDNCPLITASEDFALMLEARPGAFMLIGNGLPGEGFANLHTPEYDFNDDILVPGAAFWAQLARAEVAPGPA